MYVVVTGVGVRSVVRVRVLAAIVAVALPDDQLVRCAHAATIAVVSAPGAPLAAIRL
jgi:hypothetical protein